MIAFNYSHSGALDRAYLRHLVAYLRLSGWQQQDNVRWYEFLGEADIHGDPLLLVLPRNPDASDIDSYIDKALTLLAGIRNESVEITVQRVVWYYSDVVIVVNPEQDLQESIPLNLADAQVSALKKLVVLGARSEREPRPYFHNPSSIGQRLVEQFRFGHTIRGSFGLTIEAPIVHDIELFARKSQPPLLDNLADYVVDTPIQISPIERRVVERLMRGLAIAYTATQENRIAPLVSEYGSGFSGNMCQVVADMGLGDKPVEYRVLWSPKIPVAEDLRDVKPVRLHEASYVLLREAMREMKKIEPEVERVRGLVTHIVSNIPPLSDISAGRQVVIHWQRPDTKRIVNVIVPLNKDQYIVAHKAHIEWKTVEVSGIVVRVGSTYRLLDARDFQIVH